MAKFTIVDNGDGTADITATGTEGADWAAYTKAIATFPQGGWEALAVGTGDETQTVALPGGPYWWYAAAEADTPQAPRYHVQATPGESSTWYLAMQAIKGRIASLGLEQLNGDRIEVLKLPMNRGLLQLIQGHQAGADGSPAIVISPGRETPVRRTTASRVIAYGCLVTMFRASNQSNSDKIDLQLLWREKIYREFDDVAMPEIPKITRCEVVPGETFALSAWLKKFDAQTLTVRAQACEPR